MAIVDATYDKFPEMKPDKFAEPAFAPFYPEDVIDSGADHALVGSAQAVTLVECLFFGWKLFNIFQISRAR